MFKALAKTLQTLKSAFGAKAREEAYRDEFEAETLASGAFKGVRFTRLEDGKYADASLEKEWRIWLRKAMLIDDVI